MLQKLHSAKVAYFEMIAIWKKIQNSCLLWKTGKEFKSRTKLGEIGYIVEIVYNIFCRTLFSSFFLSANDMMVADFFGETNGSTDFREKKRRLADSETT